MKATFFCTLFSIIISFAQAQDASSYKVTSFTIDGYNLDSLAAEKEIHLAFYPCDDNNTICFTNFWIKDDTYSYGPVLKIETKEIPATSSSFRKEENQFTWWFVNSYDSITGEADVTFTKIFHDDQVEITAEVLVHDTGSLIELKGYQQ
jgi:hypothetical protein